MKTPMKILSCLIATVGGLLVTAAQTQAQPNPGGPPPYNQPYSTPPPAPAHDGFYIGFSLGAGGLQFEADGDSSERETGVSFTVLRLGGAITERFLLGANLGGWGKSFDDGSTITLVRVSAEAIYYPVLNPGGVDLFIRGGLGMSQLKLEAPGFEGEEEGGAAHLGVGIEHRFGRRFALGASLDLHYASLTDDVSANYWEAAVQFTWY